MAKYLKIPCDQTQDDSEDNSGAANTLRVENKEDTSDSADNSSCISFLGKF